MRNIKKKLKFFEKKKFQFRKKSFGSDTDTQIGPWFWFPIPKPGFGRTLPWNSQGISNQVYKQIHYT